MLHLICQHIFHPKTYMYVNDICVTCPECQLMMVGRQVVVLPALNIFMDAQFEFIATDTLIYSQTLDNFVGCLLPVDHKLKW